MTPTGWPCSSATPCPGGGAPARVRCAGPARQERGPGAQEGDKSEEHSGRLVAARMRAAGRRGEATVSRTTSLQARPGHGRRRVGNNLYVKEYSELSCSDVLTAA